MPGLYLGLVAAGNTGHSASGGRAADINEGHRNHDGEWETHLSMKMPTSVPQSTTYQQSGSSSISGGLIG